MRFVPYWPAETTGRSVTARPSLTHFATGNEQLYARWVCPDTIASTSGETLLMMFAQVPESSIVAQSVEDAPSWTSITTTSAPSATQVGRLGVHGLRRSR